MSCAQSRAQSEEGRAVATLFERERFCVIGRTISHPIYTSIQ